MIGLFYKNYLDKITATFLAIDTALSMAKLILK